MNFAIVVAAGKGTRLGGVRPKQFLELGGVPIIIHTLRQFERSQQIDEIIAVLPPEETANFLSFAQDFGLKKVWRAVAGGATRARDVGRRPFRHRGRPGRERLATSSATRWSRYRRSNGFGT